VEVKFMKTEKELIHAAIDDPGIDEKFKAGERAKMEVCRRCPAETCFSCGVWEWWIYGGTSPGPANR
jgi:hypothetical protein